MAEGIATLEPGIIADVKQLLWGDDLKEEVFLRWMQGMISESGIISGHETVRILSV